MSKLFFPDIRFCDIVESDAALKLQMNLFVFSLLLRLYRTQHNMLLYQVNLAPGQLGPCGLKYLCLAWPLGARIFLGGFLVPEYRVNDDFPNSSF